MSAPPSTLLDSAPEHDAPPLLTQYDLVNPPQANWLPLLVLVRAGRATCPRRGGSPNWR